ncbi:CocE/NonD family hydrolase [Piscibacillus salipiscarius]|uniref:CocE/NonD family hydrolase n=1 Tax=Piscibacillus salipiscarius TaxID=299480 RepID=A0ABW5QAG3_9BACI|nr:CocE/NonD family hydrolase [Piscibacillus salipiscarius]
MSEQVVIERDVPCQLRDGVTLYANVYRPESEGEYPVLLTRLPYNKNLPNFSHRYIDPIRMALDGYVVIIQDVRGRFSSEGDFKPFAQELEDGYDSVEWAASLPYSNGKVGMFGLSYYGFTQMFAAMAKPPSLKAIFPAFTGHNIDRDLSKRGGAYELAKLETWMLDSVAPDYLKRIQDSETFQKTSQELIADLDHILDWHSHFPFKDWSPVMKHPELQELYKAYIYGELSVNDRASIGDVNVPGFHMAGWYDCFLQATIHNFSELEKQGKDDQQLIIGPWGHGVFTPYFGERYFGLKASGDLIDGVDDVTSLHLKWFDHWLKDDQTEVFEEDAPIKLFVMGANEWRSEYEWPLARTNYKPLYLHNHGQLSFDKPTESALDSYVYDPDNPVPTKGGPSLFIHGINTGPLDQREVEKREDVLVYTSAPLGEDIEVTGPVKFKLYASTDVVNTDFVVKLTDVLPDGKSINVTEGIVRTNTIHGALKPGEVYEYEIDMWSTSQVFKKGHSLRVQVTSSNFPMYDPNPNTGDTLLDTTKIINANQTLHMGADYASHIILPIIEG